VLMKNPSTFPMLLHRYLCLFSIFLSSTMSKTNMMSTKAQILPMKTPRNLLISRVNSGNSMNLVLRIVGVLLNSLRMHSEHQPRSIFVTTFYVPTFHLFLMSLRILVRLGVIVEMVPDLWILVLNCLMFNSRTSPGLDRYSQKPWPACAVSRSEALFTYIDIELVRLNHLLIPGLVILDPYSIFSVQHP